LALDSSSSRYIFENMNAKQTTSMVALAGIAMAVSYWTGFVHGSSVLTARDMIASVALPIILILTLAKLTFALFFRRTSEPPSSGGSPPPIGPCPGVRAPRPPERHPKSIANILPDAASETASFGLRSRLTKDID
jgi:hypothetical protein